MTEETSEKTPRSEAPGATAGGTLDAGTQLAHERTDLAIERSYLASERTLMAWIRTTLSMISFGFTLGKIGQALGSVEVKGLLRGPRMVGVDSIAYFLVIVGTLALFGAVVQHVMRTRDFKRMGFHSTFSIPILVATLLILAGGFAFTSLVVKL
jgi:putative membrane protein